MSTDLVNQIRLIKLPPTQKFVLWLLADITNDKTRRCDPSIARLAQESGLCELTVKRAIAALELAGYVRTLRSHGRRNQYEVTSNTELLVSQSYQYHRVTEPVTQSYYSSNTELPEPEYQNTNKSVEFSFPLINGDLWGMPPELFEELVAATNETMVRSELAEAMAWLALNPTRRKTGRGMPKFLKSWITRSAGEQAEPVADPGWLSLEYLASISV